MLCMGIPENLKKLRAARSLSQPDLAKLAGVSQQLISQLENGKNAATTKLPKIAQALGVPVSEIDESYAHQGLSPQPIVRIGTPVPYAGIVQAGSFLAVDEYFNQDPDQVPSYVLPDPAYPKVRQYAWQSRGDSMDEAGILHGMWVVGADAADYIDQYGEIETGDLVIVERLRFQGQERELTVKEVHFYRDRYELRPASSNKEHKPIVVAHNHEANSDTEEVKIIGVVLTAYANLRRPRRM